MEKNSILITIDALRYDQISPNNPESSPKAAPYLKNFSEADQSVFFKQHISTGSGTSTSFPGIHASSLPLTHGYAGVNQNHTTLAEVISRNSAQTLGVTAQTSCSSLYNYDRGFDIFKDWVDDGELSDSPDNTYIKTKNKVKELAKSDTKLSPIIINLYQFIQRFGDAKCPYRRATEVTDITLSLTKKHIEKEDPFFIWVHFMEPHYPYYPPKETVRNFHNGNWSSEKVNKLISRTNLARSDIADGTMIEQVSEDEISVLHDFYNAATRYVDEEIRRLINGFKQQGLLEETVVFLTADHGEELFDHGDLGHRPKLYDELIHVPLICFDSSGEFQDNVINQITSHADIAPTIVDLFQFDTPNKWEGKSLVECLYSGSTPHRDHAITELCHEGGLGGSVNLDNYIGAIRTDEWKYIQNRQIGTEELYNITNVPGEKQNVIEYNPDKARKFKTLLDNRLDRITERTINIDTSEKVRDRLNQLGYVDE